MLWIAWGIDRVKEYGIAYPIVCPNCENEIYYQLIRLRLWALVLIIPFPYKSTHYLECPICGLAIELSREERKMAKRMVGFSERFEAGEMPVDEYKHHLSEFDHLLSPDDAPVKRGPQPEKAVDAIDEDVLDEGPDQEETPRPGHDMGNLLDEQRED